MDTLEFKVSSALKNIIGKDLITDDFIAVFELVKNSFDAYASEVLIRFEEINNGKGRIIIKDNGKGMNYEDLISKWLFVAYSAKKDGTEDANFDYRDRIHINKVFAGAKGIGRFSCDRLGKQLMLETTKQEKNSTTQVLLTDWEKFEDDDKKEFINVSVLHESRNESEFGIEHGTVLVIEDLRSQWDRPKYLKLKDSLSKLISPKPTKGQQKFKILIEVPEELDNDDNAKDYHDRVNGEVENFIFETLGLKTTKIISVISKDGEYVTTELVDGGTVIYRIKEQNNFRRLDDIEYTLYYLNQSAKLTFARRMGVPVVQYGHIFLYKNGFRIYPYGEPGEDPLKVDQRKSQGYSRFLGTRELIGQIEIYSNTDELNETSSRGDGLIKTKTYEELEAFFWIVLKRLEKYVVDVQKWGLSIEEETSMDFKSRITDLIAKLTNSNEIVDFEVPKDFIEIIAASQEQSAESVITNLNKIAHKSGDEELIQQAESAREKLVEIQNARVEAIALAEKEQKRAEEATKKLKEQISENLFLKSINTSEYQEVISLLHHIGIYAGTIDNNLKGISLRVQNNIPLTNEDLNNIIRLMSFETKKILNVVAFATKANFKLNTEKIIVDLNNYITEYIQNIIPTVTDKNLSITVRPDNQKEFSRKIKPIELNIVLDNIINNAKKANAKKLYVDIKHLDKRLVVNFIDDGIGIDSNSMDRIYDFGYTTTDGAGLGLYHVKEIMTSLKGSIKAENNENKGAVFTLEFR
ncbi:MAG TPA: ATP-binding protein [Fulvivirga sp.]|nr:ATP-binding protein [Fulvivirga sp.]